LLSVLDDNITILYGLLLCFFKHLHHVEDTYGLVLRALGRSGQLGVMLGLGGASEDAQFVVEIREGVCSVVREERGEGWFRSWFLRPPPWLRTLPQR
jgi:hypothetical protein